MLKKFKSTDIDALMNIWKKEYVSTRKNNRAELTQRYNEVRDLFLDNTSNTILYTEEDVIEGFITINKDNKIALIYVDKKIRREGIGSMLVESCKKNYDILFADSESENGYYINFLEKNGFVIDENSKEGTYLYIWKSCKEQKIRVLYFDNDLNEKLIDSNSKINAKRVSIKDILKEDKELKIVKNYIQVRKSIEKAFDKKVLLYLSCENYNEVLDEIIKEIVKIEKSDFSVVVSKPLITGNSKIKMHLEKIEQNFKNYKVHIIDTISNIRKDINVNEVLDEKMALIIRQIEKIAENM